MALNITQNENAGCTPFIPGLSFEKHVANIKRHFPKLYECLQPERIPKEKLATFFLSLDNRSHDFDGQSKGGRGDLYRRAQQNPLVRGIGIKQLFDLVSSNLDSRNLTSEHKILDVLGGDGTLAKAFSLLFPECETAILTSDISGEMIGSAVAQNLPAFRQPAHILFLKDNSFDGVIVAYGTHHIPKEELGQSFSEAFRVLKPGGRIVVHDFEEDSPVAVWFSEVVNEYSITGHNFPHFKPEEMRQHLLEAGFDDAYVQYLYDPFVVVHGGSADGARRKLADYVLNMYGLVKLVELYGVSGAIRATEMLIKEYFVYDYTKIGLSKSFGAPVVTLAEENGYCRIEMPRVALVALGTKPLKS